MTIYVVESDYGMGLVEARSAAQARKSAILDVGRSYFRSIRRAEREDIAWVRAMGGRVPSGYRGTA